MIRRTCSHAFILLVLGVLLVAAPVSAESGAVYGSTSGFNTTAHPEYGPLFMIPGQSGTVFDLSVDNFTAHSVSLIFIGNDSTFSVSTASAIEQAVWDGRILVISYPATAKFSDSLPLTTEKVSLGGTYLEPVSSADLVSKNVFPLAGQLYNITGPVTEHLAGTPKPGTIILMKYDTGEAALAYRKYGNGYVIEWAMASPDSVLGNETADRINAGVIASLRVPESHASEQTALPTTGAAAAPSSPSRTTGNITVQSNPLGATVFIDGIYQGITPLELGGFTPGYHAVKMTMDGRYDFDGSVFVVVGERITAFGSLPKQEQLTVPVNTQPVIVQVGATPAPTTASEPLTNTSVIVATIGVVTAGIGAFATIYSQRQKLKKE